MTSIETASVTRQHTKRSLIASVLIAVAFCISSTAFAQAGKAASKQQPGKKQAVDFTDQLVEGKADKPELFYLLQQRNANNKRLIRLRENFLPEIKRSAEDVGRQARPRGRGN